MPRAVAVEMSDDFVAAVAVAVVVDGTAPRRPWRANAMTSELQLDMMMMMMMMMMMVLMVRWEGATEDDCGNGGPCAWSL